jgi:hypothetical protein
MDMSNPPTQPADAPSPNQAEAIADIYKRLTGALTTVCQANCSIGAAAKEIHPMEYKEGVVCPELVIPLLVKVTSESLQTVYEILDELETLSQRRN